MWLPAVRLTLQADLCTSLPVRELCVLAQLERQKITKLQPIFPQAFWHARRGCNLPPQIPVSPQV
jgi:hypothetical protein